MTGNQMKYLLALLSQPAGRQNQSDIAKIYGVNKSTVSRAMVEAVHQGILTDTDKQYRLTGHGRDFIAKYQEDLEAVCLWLVNQGVAPDKARDDSFAILEGCSADTVSLLHKRGKLSGLYQRLNEQKLDGEIPADKVITCLEPGEYPISFIFYRKSDAMPIEIGSHGAGLSKRSMADQAFEHPAVLQITRSEAYICLRTRNMMQKSGQSHELLLGRLKTMKYQVDGKEQTVMLNDETVYIPLEVMRFVYISEEHLLRGFMECTMTCTVGNMHMPESTASLVLYFLS